MQYDFYTNHAHNPTLHASKIHKYIYIYENEMISVSKCSQDDQLHGKKIMKTPSMHLGHHKTEIKRKGRGVYFFLHKRELGEAFGASHSNAYHPRRLLHAVGSC